MVYQILITTSENMTCNYVSSDIIDIEKYISLVMDSEKCPRRSIVKIVVNLIEVE